MMKQTKNWIVWLLAAALCVMAAGCGETDLTWAAKSGEDTLPTNVYVLNLMMGYNSASYLSSGDGDLLEQEVEDVPAAEYIVNFAKTETSRMLAIKQKFEEMELTLSDEETAYAKQYAEYSYSVGQQYYDANGVTVEDLEYVYARNLEMVALLRACYSEGGELALSEAELAELYAQNYTRSQYIVLTKVDPYTGAPLSDEEVAANRALAENYYARAKAGESFTDLIHESEMARLLEGEEPYEKSEESDYDMFLPNNNSYLPALYMQTVLSAEDDSIQMVEDDQYFLIIRKLPVNEADPELLDGSLLELLNITKYEEFLTVTEQWADQLKVKYNAAVLKQYTPASLKMDVPEEPELQLPELEGEETPSSSSSTADPSDSSDAGSSGAGEPESGSSSGADSSPASEPAGDSAESAPQSGAQSAPESSSSAAS